MVSRNIVTPALLAPYFLERTDFRPMVWENLAVDQEFSSFAEFPRRPRPPAGDPVVGDAAVALLDRQQPGVPQLLGRTALLAVVGGVLQPLPHGRLGGGLPANCFFMGWLLPRVTHLTRAEAMLIATPAGGPDTAFR